LLVTTYLPLFVFACFIVWANIFGDWAIIKKEVLYHLQAYLIALSMIYGSYFFSAIIYALLPENFKNKIMAKI